MSAPKGFRAAWLSKLSHDLRNQLSPMRTATQLLQSGRLDGERQAEMLQMIERQIQRMVRMLDDVAEYGRLQGHAPKLEKLYVDYVIDGALGETGKRMRESGHAFVLNLPDERLPLSGERGRLVQMMVRLLDNAMRFTPAGGSIVMTVEARDGFAEIVLRDSGPGFDAGKIDTMFLLPDGPRSSEGLGISLLLARATAEAHGGTLDARNAPDGGAELTVRLPLAQAA